MSADRVRAGPPSPLPLPPPPPLPLPSIASSSSSSTSSALSHQAPRPPPLRRLAVPPPPTITTSLAVPLGQGTFLSSPTPASALSTANLPFSPYASSTFSPGGSTLPSSAAASLTPASPMAHRGSGAMAAYNPQEWSRHGPVGGQYVPYANPTSAARNPAAQRTDNLTGMEAALPSPPPPYSAQSMSPSVAPSPHMTSSAFAPPIATPSSAGTIHSEYASPVSSSRLSQNTTSPYTYEGPRTTITAGGSPQPPAAPSFPPPPGARDRSASRTRDVLGIFNRHKQPAEPTTNMDTLRQNTQDALQRAPVHPIHGASRSRTGITISTSVVQNTEWQQQDPNVRPPAARRAASTGAIGFAGPSRASPAVSDESPSRGGAWTPGMPLPPPPPGPPPSGSRSASTSRTPESLSASASSSSAAPPPLRRRPQTGSTLGPIPPTPAGWVDDELRNRSRSPAARGLHLDTAAASSGSSWASSGSLSRSGAQRRDSSSRGIRERRSESRAAKERMTEARTAVDYSNNPWAHDMDAAAKPADLVLSSSTSSALSRRRAVARNSRVFSSPAASPELPLKSPRNLADLGEPSSSQSTPRTGGLKLVTTSPESLGGATPTPPFSPGVEGGSSSKTTGPSPALPPKTLPTPPPQQFHEQSFSALSVPKNKDRPVSHILHVPNEEISMPAPLSPMRPPSAGVTRSTSPGRTGKQSAKPSDKELFAQAAVERHKAFVEKEIAAQSDQERLELFAEFIVGESRIRRDRYKVAFDAMASDILDLTRDMWRSYNTTGRRSATPGASTAPSTGMDRSVDGQATVASSVSPHSNYTSRTEPESPSSTKSRNRGDSQLWDRFEPCLSPIPSMNVSTVPDEEDSRGRSSSRWWEASADGSQGRGKKVMRTKRESKYMGVPKEAREHLQWDAENSPAYTATPGPIDYSGYGPNEYPPEKVGLHEDGSLPASAHSYHLYTHSAPTTPDPFRLDVSRLVTLPPPYPRHYPAVNNHHPDLASLRTIHRNLGELEEVNAIKELYLKKTNARREQERVDSGERRNKLRRGTQEQIRADLISFQDAAKAEYDFEVSEARRAQEIAQMEFDSFKKDVNQRLTAILSERITKATATIDHLRSSLCQDAQDPSPNQPQEEGDEQPELLEKLTLLKWLFESREASHREMFDLEGESNDRYKTVVLTPYIRANNHEKVKEAENFFAQDAQERQVIFEKETLKRFEDFVTVIESMVTRGVEVQLSAFWDIAPGLMTVVQKVPPNLDASFQILIPPDEYRENPVYHDHPLQYLHTLLTHAKKSTYQFIESQTNLLCLLHEVKTGVMTANTRLLETQRLMDGGEDEHAIKAEMGDLRAYEERRLTDDLKDKVALVEEQWEEGLGSGLEDCLKRVERFLEETGGWDEGLDE